MPKASGPGPPPPKAKAKTQVKWSERQKAQARVERLLSFSVVQQWRDSGESCSIDTVDWSAVDSVVHVGGGSGGVLLVRFATGRLLCVKPQRLEARGELFASFLADALGIPTARLRVLPMTEQIMSCLRNAKLEISDHQLHVEKKILADAKYLGLVEFVQGPIMEGEDFTKHFRGCSDDRLKRFWVGAGQLAAFDCLINNLDRLPLIWANDGNLKNLMVDFPEEGLRVIGIDQAVRGISDAGLAKYLGSLRDLLHALWDSEAGWESSSSFRRVHAAIEVNFQEEFQVHALGFKLGLQEAFRRIAWCWPSSFCNQVDESRSQVAAVFGCEPAELDLLHCLVRAAATTIAEEVQKLDMKAVPQPIIDIFRKLLPQGQFTPDQLASFLQELDPSLQTTPAKDFLNSFSSAGTIGTISCSEFLGNLFRMDQ
ncbi:Putative actin-fragmin kinase DDB_G0279609 [Durusdinium trenchii]|uniref:Actin-fragmin kinase DDB_G0279609 n=1 Tax=Durusdinium trenchii TaxID=1381693 RepID=A0ABP0LGR2_9DINO